MASEQLLTGHLVWKVQRSLRLTGCLARETTLSCLRDRQGLPPL